MSAILAAVAATLAHMGDHFNSLIGERPAGSKWGRSFTRADFELGWEEQQVEAPVGLGICKYFRLTGDAFRAAFPNATLGARPLPELTDEEASQVSIVEGPHGLELQSAAPLAVDTDEAWLILGPGEGDAEGQMVVWTAHPGPLMMPLRVEDPSLSDLRASGLPYAVKSAE